MVINKKLAEEVHLSPDTIKRIEALHEHRESIYKTMETCDSEYLSTYDERLNEMEAILQELWGFEKNPNYVKFWERPRCSCPKMDNNDRYPVGYYVIVDDCPLHGRKN